METRHTKYIITRKILLDHMEHLNGVKESEDPLLTRNIVKSLYETRHLIHHIWLIRNPNYGLCLLRRTSFASEFLAFVEVLLKTSYDHELQCKQRYP